MKHTALITGSSRGLGQAIALRLAQDGYHLILHGEKPSRNLTSALKAVQTLDPQAIAVIFDVTNELAVAQTCRQFKSVDILINNAGISRDAPLLKMTSAQWNAVINTNLTGTFNVTKQILPLMVNKRFGRIINMSSVAGERGAYGKTNYAAAKAGLIGFTKSLAQELAKFGVTVNAVCPAWVNTGMSLSIPEKYRKISLHNVALGRMAKPREIAALVSFLASGESDYITGAVFDINGGMS